MSKHGIFCLEGDWWGTPHKRTTVEPLFTLLRTAEDWEVPYKHRDVATRPEFEHYLEKWQQANHDAFPILYLAFHGEEGTLLVGADGRLKESRVDLDWLEANIDVRGKNRMLYIGACSTLDLHGNRINNFLKNTGINAVCGYRGDIDWMESTTFDLLMLSSLCSLPTITPTRIVNKYKDVRALVGGLAEKLDFRLVIRPE
jgi:hypothetical protein